MSRWQLASCLLTLAAFGLWGWALADPSMFPERVPIHWDINDQPNSWTDAHTAALTLGSLPGIMLFCLLLGVLLPWWTPGTFSAPEDRRRLDYILFLTVGLFGFLFLEIANGMRTGQVHGRWLFGSIFVLFGLLGPALRGIRRNRLVGVRTPWTLASDDVWNRTHAMTAKLWPVIGGVGVLLMLVGTPVLLMLLLLVPAVVWPIVYSYRISPPKAKRA
jgi:uncharacterized membrane protein